MALFKTGGAAIYGIDAHLIDVEVDMFASGNPRDSVMVGMPDVAVRESRERIKSALINSGFGYPNKRITINLAPANVRKEGAGFDLPVAMGILGAMGPSGAWTGTCPRKQVPPPAPPPSATPPRHPKGSPRA
jgi:magnesium chelatase family protein